MVIGTGNRNILRSGLPVVVQMQDGSAAIGRSFEMLLRIDEAD